MHAFFDITLIAGCIILLVCWLHAEGQVRLVCGDLVMKTAKFAIREADFRAKETAWRLQVENYQEQMRDLERLLRERQ